MICPRCKSKLSQRMYKGIEVDRCSSCKGMWLDYDEMDQLEDKVLDDDDIKGEMMFRSYVGDMECPKCSAGMQMFHYSAFDVELDICPSDHGFWLDNGEEKKVLDIMKKRVKDLKRVKKAEAEWYQMLRKMKSKSFGERMKDLFRK